MKKNNTNKETSRPIVLIPRWLLSGLSTEQIKEFFRRLNKEDKNNK